MDIFNIVVYMGGFLFVSTIKRPLFLYCQLLALVSAFLAPEFAA